MKRMITTLLLAIFFCTNIDAMSSLQKPFVYLGQALENINLPIIGKLTNILPCAMVSNGLQQCPGQSMLLLTGLLVYALSQNQKVNELLAQYKAWGLGRLGIKQPAMQEYDETLFIFDGEDADDAEEQMDTEDELLEFEQADEDDTFRKEKNQEKHVLKFL
jgi:hypothetical protein